MKTATECLPVAIADTWQRCETGGMQELIPNQAGRLARRDFSSALMSDTKWRKAFAALEAADAGLVQMIVKFIDVAEPHIMNFPPGLAHCPRAYMDTIEFGPTELRAIEWLEFRKQAELRRPDKLPARAIDQNISRAAEAVRSLGRYPVELSESSLRIVGYRR